MSAIATMLPPGSQSSTRYTLGPEIGRGGMGVVYEAQDTRLRRKVAIKFLGEAGIVHRDLKPSNIMVARDGRLKILDFGLSKLSPRAPLSDGLSEEVTLSSGPKTARGVVVGSPGYMSPEQAVGADVDARSDVFSLGVVLFEMTSGTRPCAGDDLRALLQEPPRSLLRVGSRRRGPPFPRPLPYAGAPRRRAAGRTRRSLRP